MSLEALGVDSFQLYLLKAMDPPARLLQAALDHLGSTAEDLLAHHEAVSEATKLGRPGLRERYESILAEAFLEETADSDRDRSARGFGSAVLNYCLPVWPDFIFQLKFDDSGRWLYSARFARLPDAPPGSAASEWRFLESELAAAFADVRELDVWGGYASYLAVGKQLGERVRLRFGFGLLQEITPSPEPPVQ